jgi:hypothetical protein
MKVSNIFLTFVLLISDQGLPAVRRAGLPAIIFIRRLYGGLAGLSAVHLEGLISNPQLIA